MENKVSLLKLKDGEEAVVKEINSGLSAKEKLNAMGIYPGAVLKKYFSHSKGPVIVEILRSKIAIGRGMADKIKVEKRETNTDGKS